MSDKLATPRPVRLIRGYGTFTPVARGRLTGGGEGLRAPAVYTAPLPSRLSTSRPPLRFHVPAEAKPKPKPRSQPGWRAHLAGYTTWIGAAAMTALTVALLYLMVGVMDLYQARQSLEQNEAGLLATLPRVHEVIAPLSGEGADVRVLEANRLAFLAAPSDAERLQTAEPLLRAARQAAASLPSSDPRSEVRLIRERVRELDRAVLRYSEARARHLAATAHPAGQLAAWFGAD